MARRVLIVSTVEHGDDVLQAHVGDADEIKVVVPVVRQGALDWLANDEKRLGMRNESPSARPPYFPAKPGRRSPGSPTSISRSAMRSPRSRPMRSSLRFAPATRKGLSSRSRPTAPRNEQGGRARSVRRDSGLAQVPRGRQLCLALSNEGADPYPLRGTRRAVKRHSTDRRHEGARSHHSAASSSPLWALHPQRLSGLVSGVDQSRLAVVEVNGLDSLRLRHARAFACSSPCSTAQPTLASSLRMPKASSSR